MANGFKRNDIRACVDVPRGLQDSNKLHYPFLLISTNVSIGKTFSFLSPLACERFMTHGSQIKELVQQTLQQEQETEFNTQISLWGRIWQGMKRECLFCKRHMTGSPSFASKRNSCILYESLDGWVYIYVYIFNMCLY